MQSNVERKIREAMRLLTLLPCGGIGENGATEDELAAAAEEGRWLENDATVDIGQRCWLVLNRAVKQENGRRNEQEDNEKAKTR